MGWLRKAGMLAGLGLVVGLEGLIFSFLSIFSISCSFSFSLSRERQEEEEGEGEGAGKQGPSLLNL